MLADLYDDSFLAEARVVEAVAEEVRRRAQRQIEPGDPRRTADVTRGARTASRRYYQLLEAATARPAPAPAGLVALETRMRCRAQAKHPGQSQHPAAHRGESESIHAAVQDGSAFVSCDDDARGEAIAEQVHSETFADLARRIDELHHDVKPKRIVAELQRLARTGFDIGDVVQSVLDLRTSR